MSMVQLSIVRQEIILSLYDAENGVSRELTKRQILESKPVLKYGGGITSTLKRMAGLDMIKVKKKPFGKHEQDWISLSMTCLEMAESLHRKLVTMSESRERRRSSRGMMRYPPEQPLWIDWGEYLEKTRFTSQLDATDQQVIC